MTMTHYEFKEEVGGELVSPNVEGQSRPFDFHFLSEKEAMTAKDDWAPDADWMLVKITLEVVREHTIIEEEGK